VQTLVTESVVNVIEKLASAKNDGKPVPVNVIVSPPISFMSVFWATAVIVQETVVSVTAELSGTLPFLVTIIGLMVVPQAGG